MLWWKRVSALQRFSASFNQLQYGEPIPAVIGIDYQTNIGINTVLDKDNGLGVGLAYNHATIDSDDLAVLSKYGIDGNASTLIFGVCWYSEDWYLGTVVSRLQNHETTNQQIYFDGTGWEVYGQYRLLNEWWAVAG